MLFGGTALIAAAVGGYFYSKRRAHQKGSENGLMLTLVSRKAAIPVPGPIGGGSLSDWKEAEGNKGDVKSGNSKSGNTEAGNSKD